MGKRPEQIMAHLTFAAGPCSSSSGQSGRGTFRSAAIACGIENSFTRSIIDLKASLTDDHVSYPSGTAVSGTSVGTYLQRPSVKIVKMSFNNQV